MLIKKLCAKCVMSPTRTVEIAHMKKNTGSRKREHGVLSARMLKGDATQHARFYAQSNRCMRTCIVLINLEFLSEMVIMWTFHFYLNIDCEP